MRNILLLSFLAFGISLFGQGINFHKGDVNSVFDRAKAEGKLVFIDAYTDWCGPCKWLARAVFPDQALGELYNENFISYQLDMEKGEGIAFAKKYEIRAFPTLLYFDSEGNEAYRILGAMEAADLIEKTNYLLIPENRMGYIGDLINKGEYSNELLKKYLKGLGDSGKSDHTRVAEFLEKSTTEDWADMRIIDLILNHNSGEPDVFLNYIINNYKTINKLLAGHEDYLSYMNGRLERIFMNLHTKALNGPVSYDVNVYDTFIDDNPTVFNTEKIMIQARRYSNAAKNDPALKARLDNQYFNEYCDSWQELNSAAWNVYENENADQKMIADAIVWARKSVSLNENYYNTDTLAHLLYANGNKKEALLFAKKAEELGLKDGEDVSATQDLIKKLK